MADADGLGALDRELAALLARRIEMLVAPAAPGVDDQLAPGAPGVPGHVWRAVVSHTAAAAGARRAPVYRHAARNVTIIGGKGAMGRLLGAAFERHGHAVIAMDRDDWVSAEELLPQADLVLVAVPIDVTEEVIGEAAPSLKHDALLADITSLKVGPVAAMLAAHAGPVVGLHPMFGPHVSSMMAQRVVACPARDAGAADWVLDLFRAEGAVVVEATPEEHDRMMVAVQAIRHFSTFALGVFLAEEGIDVGRSLEFASPIYRLEIDIVSRLFAQSPELYLSIMSATEERTAAIERMAATFERLARALAAGDHATVREAFGRTAARLGAEAPRALAETTLAVEALSAALAARSG